MEHGYPINIDAEVKKEFWTIFLKLYNQT